MDDAGTLYSYGEPKDTREADGLVALRPEIDYIVRVKEDFDNSSVEILPIEETQEFFYEIHSLIQDNISLKTSLSVLGKSLNNIWKIHSYHQEYISYLLGSCTKDEFKKIAETYAEPIVEDVDGDQLIAAADILCSTLNQTLPITDLSLLLNVTPSYFNETTKLLGYSPEECGIE